MYGSFQENLSKKMPPLHFFAEGDIPKQQNRLLAKSGYTSEYRTLRKLQKNTQQNSQKHG